MPRTFLLKSEPGEYSFADLQRDGRTTWSGVSNPGALIALRTIRRGDCLLIYHTGNEKAIVGLARAVSNAFEDPKRPGKNDAGEPKFAVIDLEATRALREPVSLARIKSDKRFAKFPLVVQSRLSAMEVPSDLARLILEWGT